MKWLKKLYLKTKKVAATYTSIFVVVMFLNQLLFFGLCLNPICLVAAMPHVLFITIVLGMWFYKPNRKKLKKTLIFFRETYEEVSKNIKENRDIDSDKLFTGNIYMFVTQNKSQGEEDFITVLSRHIRPNISSIIRLDNRHESKALLTAINNTKHLFVAGDIIVIVRGGGDTSKPQFNSYKDTETCNEIKYLSDNRGIVSVSGIGHSTDSFPIEQAVNFAQITPTDAASRVVDLINGGKW